MPSVQEYGPPAGLGLAREIVAHAEGEAAANRWALVIAVLDSSGRLVLLHRMDQAQYGVIAVAQAKAMTALNFKRPTKVFEDAVAAGGLGLRVLATDGLCPLEGGLLLVVHGKIVGAIGVSGAQSTQDRRLAGAGAAVLNG